MRTIKIEGDIYGHLLQNVEQIGESASEILRRLLRIPMQKSEVIEEIAKDNQSEILECVTSIGFQTQPNVVKKFLFILSFLYEKDTDKFRKVLTLYGRSRKYFALGSEELEKSGSSVYPRQIPHSPYWVITNNDTLKKQRMLEAVLKRLGYSNSAIKQAVKALV